MYSQMDLKVFRSLLGILQDLTIEHTLILHRLWYPEAGRYGRLGSVDQTGPQTPIP